MASRSAQVKVGVALAGVAALLFGMTAPFLKQASAGVGALLSGSLVYLGAALGAGLAAAVRAREDQPATFSRAAGVRLLVVALLGAVLAPALLVLGLRRVDGATASLLLALEAPFTIVLARLFLREFIGGRVLVAAALIMAGGVTLVGASLGSGVTLPGVVLVAAAMMAWSLDNVLSRPLAEHDPLRVVMLKGFVGAAVSGLIAVVAGEARPSVAKALALLGLGAAGYGVSLQLYLRAQRVVGVARTASVFATAPFVGVLVAFLFGAPWPGVGFVLAAVLIAAGVALHISERHEHLHRHEPAEHEHMHRHDDGHHDHRHDPMPDAPHSHPHDHPAVTHRHEHSEDIHHRHVHDAELAARAVQLREAPMFGADDIVRVLERIRSLGVEWRGTRFEMYRDELAAHVSSTPDFIASFRSDERRQRLMFEAGSQIMQVVLAERIWDLLDPRLLAGSLRLIVGGPELDAPADDRPRNTLVELVAAAVLAGRFTTELTARDEDVRLQHAVVGLGAVESKRPLHSGTLLSNMNKIGEQLRARALTGSQYGVAVIGGDRIEQTAGHGYEAETFGEAKLGMQERALHLANEVERLSKDPACWIAPAATRAIVVVTGAVLVRQPRPILQPISVVLERFLGAVAPRRELQQAFEGNRGPALEDLVVDHRYGVRR